MNTRELFQVELNFRDKANFTDSELQEMSEEIAKAITIHCEQKGIVPDTSENVVEVVYVRDWFHVGNQAIEHVY